MMGGVLSLVKSRKFWLMLFGILAMVGVIKASELELAIGHVMAVIGGIAWIVGKVISGIAEEDAAAKASKRQVTGTTEHWHVTTPVVPVSPAEKRQDGNDMHTGQKGA